VSNGESNLASNRDCNGEDDSGRNGLNDKDSNGQSYVEDNLDNNSRGYLGGGGGDFREGDL